MNRENKKKKKTNYWLVSTDNWVYQDFFDKPPSLSNQSDKQSTENKKIK